MRGKRHLVWLVPGLCVALGGTGAWTYRRFLAAAIEPDTALLTPGLPITYLLVALVVGSAALLALLAALGPKEYPDSYGHSFYAPHPVPLALCVVAGGLVAAAGLLALSGYVSRADRQLSRLVLGLVLLPAAVALEEIARRNYLGETQKGRLSALLLAPGYVGCVWLVYAYQAHTANPVALDYSFLLLGIVAAILAFYYQASFSFEKPKPRRAVWSAAMAAVLLLTAMGHGEGAMTACLCLGTAVYHLTQLTVLLYRGLHPAALPPLELPADPENSPEKPENSTEDGENPSENTEILPETAEDIVREILKEETRWKP